MKNKIKSLIFLFIIIYLFIFISQGNVFAQMTESDIQMIKSSDEILEFNMEIPWKTLELLPMTAANKEYVEVNIDGWLSTSQQGAPKLPVRTEMIAVPLGAKIDVLVTPGKAHKLKLDAPVIPVMTRVINDFVTIPNEGQLMLPDFRMEVVESSHFYTTDLSFPERLALITNQGFMRQQQIAALSIFPVQYVPGNDELIVYENLNIAIRFTGSTLSKPGDVIGESDAFEKALSDNLLNYEEGKNWRRKDVFIGKVPSAGTAQDQVLPWSPPDPGWRVSVNEEGFHKLTYDQLGAADFPLDTALMSTFQMFHLGNEIALEVFDDNDNNLFDPGDYILFYVQEFFHKYSDVDEYWLTHGVEEGLRVQSRDVPPVPENTNIPESFDSFSRFEENEAYNTWVPGENNLERFLWDYLNSTSQNTWDYEISLPELATAAVGNLRIALVGYTSYPLINPDHHALIFVNDQMVSDVVWDGRTWEIIDVPLPSGLLKSGDNSLRIEAPSTFAEAYYIDWFEVEYTQNFVIISNALTFTYDVTGTEQFQISGFNENLLWAYDVTDAGAVTRLDNFVVQLDGLAYKLLFEDKISGLTDYLVTSETNFLTPEKIEKDRASELAAVENHSDYLIITHKDFGDHLGDLRALRESQGLRVTQVDVQDTYDEFNFGITDPGAIKDFLQYTYYNWTSPAPIYVLLVGDGHFNPKNYNTGIWGFGRDSFIPPYLVIADPLIGETASDNHFVSIVGDDGLPDMMIGRMSVNNTDQVTALIDKILTYEQTPVEGDWNKQVLALADNTDAAGSFPAMSEGLLSCCLPDNFPAHKIYLGITQSDIDAARAEFIAGFNAGKFIINYIGHGAYSQWAGRDDNQSLSGHLLKTAEVSGLTNDGKYPVILSMSCFEGMFHFPHLEGSPYEAMAEVVTKADEKGAIASWSPTGAGLAAGHDILNKGFFNAVFKNGVQTIGEATLKGKLDLWATGSNLDLVDTFMLFGDPALTIAIRRYKNFMPLIYN